MGEFDRIDLFLQAFRAGGGVLRSERVPLGPGDDCAIVQTARPLAITTDALVEDVHFKRAWVSWRQVGHKALAVNLSDLAAMGARPTLFTCAFGLPSDVDDQALADLARGMAALAARWDVVLAGGNFSRAREVSVTITALGELSRAPLLRDGARAGDRVLVAGALGVAGAELRRLLRGEPLPEGHSLLHEPLPQVDAGLALPDAVRCGIDVSDGLWQDLGHVARASGVGVRLDLARVPRTERFRQLTRGLSAAEEAHLLLAGGEDYALVVTAPPAAAEALAAGGLFAEIGEVVAGGGVSVAGLPAGVALAGHDHFG